MAAVANMNKSKFNSASKSPLLVRSVLFMNNEIFVNSDAAENFINNWNAEFPDYQLTVEDFKKPHSLFRYLFRIFDRLGIDNDAVLMVSFIAFA